MWRASLRNFTNVECVGGRQLTHFREVSARLSQRAKKISRVPQLPVDNADTAFLDSPTQVVRIADTLSQTEGRTVYPHASLILFRQDGPKAVAAEIGYWKRMSLQLSAYCI